MNSNNPLPTTEINRIVAGFRGRIGVFIKDISSGAEYEHASDDRFPTASVCKLPVLVELFRQAEDGTLSLQKRERLHRNVSRLFASGCLRMFEDEPELTLLDYCRVMISVSDDMAADILMDAVGLENVNATMTAIGLANTRVNMTMGTWHYTMVGLGDLPCSLDADEVVRRKWHAEGLDYQSLSFQDSLANNVTSPRDMGSVLECLHRGEVVSKDASESMIALLKTCQDRRMIARDVRLGVPIAHKIGSSGRIRGDVGIVYLPTGVLIISALALAADDQASGQDAIAEISRTTVAALSPESIIDGKG